MMDGRPPLGRLLRRYRASASLTQEELAERARISVRTVSDVERGLRGSVHPGTAERLADALRLPPAERAGFEDAAHGRRGPRISDVAEKVVGLPTPLTTLIGRERELGVLHAALTADGIRLMTVTGPGGVGKTRLALAAAAAAGSDFPDGVVFVPLGAHREVELVAAVIADAMGVRLAPGSSDAALADQLRGQRSLLVLDTFEHLLGAAPLVGGLLAACPGLAVLVTSRSLLHLHGERELVLAPLQSPPRDARPGEAQRFPAVALFLERARAVAPDLRLEPDTEAIIADICRRLDGLPLAIELAAARARHLPLASLRDHLDDRMGLLTGGPVDAPPRQRTLRATLAWSYDLLDAAAQRFLRESSVLVGGWTLEAARAVCTDGIPIDVVSALVDHNLVSVAEGPRYAMLDVVAEYAAELRDVEGETDGVRRRHADHFLALAERAEPELGRTGQSEWYHRLLDDRDNLRVALRSSIDSAHADTAVRLSGALWQFWRRHGDVAEGRAWLGSALALPGQVPALARSKALWGAGWLAYHQGDLAEADSIGATLHNLARDAGDPLGERNALTILGKVAAARGRYEESADRLRAALAICPILGTSWLMATSVYNLGVACVQGGKTEEGAALVEEAVQRYRELGDGHFSAKALGFLVYPALLAGDLELALELSTRSLTMCVDLGELSGIADCLDRRATVLAARGRPESAAQLAGAAEGVRRGIGVQATPDDRPMIDDYMAVARSAAGEQAWRAARQTGRSTPLEEVLRLSVAEAPSDWWGLPAGQAGVRRGRDHDLPGAVHPEQRVDGTRNCSGSCALPWSWRTAPRPDASGIEQATCSARADRGLGADGAVRRCAGAG